jgi:hypothetical protein
MRATLYLQYARYNIMKQGCGEGSPFGDEHRGVLPIGNLRESTVSLGSFHINQLSLCHTDVRIHVKQLVELAHLSVTEIP